MKRLFFLFAVAITAILDRLRGRALAINTTLTPLEARDGVASLHGTAAIATKNYAVVRGADDAHFKVASAATDVPLGILRNDELTTAEVDVVKKNVALFGVYPGTLEAVAEAAITVDDRLVLGTGTPGRVKSLPATPGVYWVVGRSRFTVSNAGDPVSIIHCTPYQVRVGIGYTTGEGGAVTQATSKSTGVTLSKLTGEITLHNANLATQTVVSFTLTNTLIAATDLLVLNHASGGTVGAYAFNAQCAAGSAVINVTNITGGTLGEAPVIRFAVVKGAAA